MSRSHRTTHLGFLKDEIWSTKQEEKVRLPSQTKHSVSKHKRSSIFKDLVNIDNTDFFL